MKVGDTVRIKSPVMPLIDGKIGQITQGPERMQMGYVYPYEVELFDRTENGVTLVSLEEDEMEVL